jgi:hypothetical protein
MNNSFFPASMAKKNYRKNAIALKNFVSINDGLLKMP